MARRTSRLQASAALLALLVLAPQPRASGADAPPDLIVFDLEPGTASSHPQDVVAIGDVAYFRVSGAGAKRLRFIRTDGLTTTPVTGVSEVFGMPTLIKSGNAAWFVAATPDGRNGLGRILSGGTTAELVPAGDSGLDSVVAPLTPFGDGSVIFRGHDAIHGWEPWVADSNGVVKRLGDTAVHPDAFGPNSVQSLGATAVFWMYDPPPGWIACPSNIDMDPTCYDPKYNYSGGTLTLWSTDGTTDGTYVVRSIPNTDPYTESGRGVAGGLAWFVDYAAGFGSGNLWRTDGSPSGTFPVCDLLRHDLGNGASTTDVCDRVLDLDGHAVFLRSSGADSQVQLWRSDGTREGTTRVEEFQQGEARPAWFPANEVVVDGKLFLIYYDSLWVTDASSMPRRLWSSAYEGTINTVGVMDGRLLFSDYDAMPPSPTWTPPTRMSVWTTDGTPQNTRRLSGPWDLPEGATAPNQGLATVVGDRALLGVADKPHGVELWSIALHPRGDGTTSEPAADPIPVQFDTDGDGYPDEVEAATGSDSTDPGVCPLGMLPIADPAALIAWELNIVVDFRRDKGTVRIRGDLPVTDVDNGPLIVDVGGVVRVFASTARGTAKSADASLRLRRATQRASGRNARLTRIDARFSGADVVDALRDEGVAPSPRNRRSLDIPAYVFHEGARYDAVVHVRWHVTRSGRGVAH